METCLFIDENDLEKIRGKSIVFQEIKRKYDSGFLEGREGVIEWDFKFLKIFIFYQV